MALACPYHPPVPEEHFTRFARQPFTFGGVARFAEASFVRLISVALLFGLISGLVVSWLTSTRWAPVADEAISQLPSTGSIDNGVLHWPEKAGRLLAANPFISFEVAITEFPTESAPVDFAFEFRTNQVVTRSLLGTQSIPYPRRWDLELNRTALSPAWGAWKAPLLFGLIPATALALLLTWGTLAIVYALLPRGIGALFRRDFNMARAWKLSVAAQLPGSLLLAFALALYSTGHISLLFVLIMVPAHFVPTLFYLLISPLFVPKAETDTAEANPFEARGKRPPKGKNPFRAK